MWGAQTSWACPTGREVHPGLSGGTGYPIWPGNTLEPLEGRYPLPEGQESDLENPAMSAATATLYQISGGK